MSEFDKPFEPVGSTPLKETFFAAHGLNDGEGIYFDTDTETDQDSDTDIAEQSSYDYSPEARQGFIKKLANIEDLINCNDFVGAAEELLKINIANIPQNLFERFTDALEITADNLSLKDTYLNAQLAAQSLVVCSIQDELLENGVLFALEEVKNGFTMEDLKLSALGGDSNIMATLAWLGGDIGEGMADEHNPQESPNTAVLARFMTQQSENEHQGSSMARNDALAKHVYNLEMRLGA